LQDQDHLSDSLAAVVVRTVDRIEAAAAAAAAEEERKRQERAEKARWVARRGVSSKFVNLQKAQVFEELVMVSCARWRLAGGGGVWVG
jgi:phosphoenolpyruvate synthase/pyruvate phosphate dikinase